MIRIDFFHKNPTDRPIFIFSSTHRSGSTLLQRLINSCADVIIWGEQNGYLNGFVNNFELLMDWESKFSNNRKTYLLKGYNHFLPNLVPEDHELISAAAHYIISLFGVPAAKLGKSIWGFKEVRYGVNVALFLQKCFPHARFIHLNRNIVDCFISMKKWEDSGDQWNRKWSIKSIKNWQKINTEFFDKGKMLSNLLQIKYERMVSDPVEFIEHLSGFLEIPKDSFDLSVFDKRIDGSEPFQKKKISRTDLTKEEKTLLSQDSIKKIAKCYDYKIDF